MRSEIKCRECDGFGHIQLECANTLKKKQQVLQISWNDGNSERSREEKDHFSNHVALTTRYAAVKTSYDDVSQHVLEDAQSRDPDDVPAHDSDSSD